LVTEAVCAVLHYASDALHLHRICATVFKRSPASARVLEKIGMPREGCFREHYLKWDRFEDVWNYAILKSDYLKIQSRAE
jgi:[ribosomal protein S5]-alanine N-acetyltransferase